MPATTYTPPANTILHHTEGYLDSRPPAPPVHLVQYDMTLPVLAVALYLGSQPYTVPANADVNIRMAKPDGTVIYDPALGVDTARTTVYIPITEQMTVFAGDFRPILEITADGGIAGTSVLALSIDRNPIQNEKLQSSDEYKTVQELTALAAQSAAAAAASAQAAAGSETAAGSSESSAAGSASSASADAAQAAQDAQTATEKAAAAEASAQAAQEAAEQAQQIAQGGLGYYETPEALRTAHPTAEAGNWAIVGDPDGIWVWDVEGEAWVNSGQNIELSNYYTKPQTDQRIEEAKGTVFSIAVSASGWQGDAAPYTNTVPVEGMTADTILSCIQLAPAFVGNAAAEAANGQWDELDTLDGAVVFTAENVKPAADFTILASTKQHLGSANDIVVPAVDVDTLKQEILSALIFPNAGSHNSIYRGKYLGEQATGAQYSAIAAGTFDDLFIGDYWTMGGVNYRIAAFDYYMRCGNPVLTTHHVLLVPDTPLYNYTMNATNTTAGGYVGSKMYTEGLTQALNIIKSAFSGHVLTHKLQLSNAVTDGHPSNASWYDVEVELMNEQMLYGGAIFMPIGGGSASFASYRAAKSQLPLFSLMPEFIAVSNANYWLRDVITSTKFGYFGGTGYADCLDASNSRGVRPAFCIHG